MRIQARFAVARCECVCVVCAAMLISVAARGQNLITNGGFEEPAVPAGDADGGIRFMAPADIPGGWRLIDGSADILRRAGATQFQVVDGAQAIDLNGGSRGTLRRTLDLSGPAVFRLSYWLSGNPTCGAGIQRATITLENVFVTSPTFSTVGRSVTDMAWQYFEFSFAGLPDPVTLTFQSVTGTDCGPMIDDVRLVKCLEIEGQPAGVTACAGSAAMLSVSASSDPGDAAQYRWRRGGGFLEDGGNVVGAHTPILVIDPVSNADAGAYSCVVFNFCGELTSASAVLTVVPAPCPGDANGDSVVDFGDVTSVLQFWNTTHEGTGPGDPNCDGVVNFGDVTAVLKNWGVACS